MASKKSMEANNTPLLNTRIKIEPGTSASPALLLKNIKTEPGLSASTTRLTSFRVPRDLTLGGNVKSEKPKKVYTPNINVQRNKKKDDGAIKKSESKPARGRGRGRGQGERGRGRGKTPSNLVQQENKVTGPYEPKEPKDPEEFKGCLLSTGVFSEGITEESRGGRRYGGYRDSSEQRDTKAFMEKPLLKLNQNINKAEEEEKLKTLLRDDFIDDGMDISIENGPVTLPLIEEGKLYKKEPQEVVKAESPVEEEIDVKPIILANGEAVMPPKAVKIKPPTVSVKQEAAEATIPQIIENQTNGYMLIQLPDCLPGLRTSDEPSDPRASKSQKEPTPAAGGDNSPKSEYCTLGSLKGGMLGKIQICKSGKARLIIGDNSMLIDVGSRLSFRQDLVAAKIDTPSSAELVNLGRVTSTLICSPDWETMLSCL